MSAQATIVGVIPTPERWPDEDLAGFEIRFEDDESTGNGNGDADGGDTAENDSGQQDGAGDQEDSGDGDDTDDGDDAGDGTDATDGQEGGTDAAADDDTPDCDFRGWPPDEVERYDVTLVDRKDDETPDADTPEEETTLYVSADVDVESDAPYVINRHQDCDDDYVGVELESIEGGGVERDDQPEEVEDDPNEGGQDEDGTVAEGPGFGVLAALAAALGLGGLLARERAE